MTSRYVSSCHADLVQQIAIGSDKRVVGLAAKDIDCPARNLLFVAFVGKQRASGWLCDAPPSLIFIECPLQRAESQIAFRPVVVDDAHAHVNFTVRSAACFTDFRTTCNLTP